MNRINIIFYTFITSYWSPFAAQHLMTLYFSSICMLVRICSSGVTFYNQLSEIFEKRRQEITTICKSEKERLQKIVEKAKQIKGIFQTETI